MINVMSNEDFRMTLRCHLEKSGQSINEFAREVGRPRETVRGWFNYGIKSEVVRAKTIAQLSQVFGNMTQELAQQFSESKPVNSPNNVLVLIKTEQIRMLTENISSILGWFIKSATREERNTFRSAMGEDWPRFLGLTRAMTNETALKVSIDEGGLDWLKQQQ